MDLCDADQKAAIEEIQDLSMEELEEKIAEKVTAHRESVWEKKKEIKKNYNIMQFELENIVDTHNFDKKNIDIIWKKKSTQQLPKKKKNKCSPRFRIVHKSFWNIYSQFPNIIILFFLQTKEIEAAEEVFKTEVENLQAKYEEISAQKDASIDAVKKSGLGLLKSMKAAKKKAEDKDEL